ncbi:FAD-binding and (Fe-S)-binding domain-containing protein [Thioalkalivibrio sp. HK1]|uniref:FAD-binding and (Fe-S)-binding domain-containing protein n=1 Tax=Thioalkalivibrio sp. HK1 TaxID=1469245 RepID=UPI00046EEB66|nr:FAD-binding and (Fe-S)-binding domain-containing protein [Thioalkalivibrio sp. HK1]
MRHRAQLRPGNPGLARLFEREIEGETLFDPASRGRYATDASIYQIEPLGVVVPRHVEDIRRTIDICKDAGVPVLPRGAGTSQCGQTVGEAIVVDTGKYLDRMLHLDEESRRVRVEPGIVLDRLNALLKPKGLFFPVDVSTASRATIGGMTGNNSCGARSIRYGNMVHNVRAIDAILADGSTLHAREIPENLSGNESHLDLIKRLRALGAQEAEEIESRFPKLLRRVGGYNIDSLVPSNDTHNLAHLLVGSEGTLGFFTAVELDLQAIPTHRMLGVCHFPTFYESMEAVRHITALDPSAVELVDRRLIELARQIELFRPTVERFVSGDPDALLLVEFAGEDRDDLIAKINDLDERLADLGFPDAVVKAERDSFQSEIWEVRKAGLNIMMSMKGDGKPISFVEDCAVRLEDLAEYTRRLDAIFARHGTRGTWYAHASVGTLHVRPIIDLKVPEGARTMRAIAEECFEMVREYEGSHSGEHGDGIVRSEFHEAMFGARLVAAFEEVKKTFDPRGLFNPGKIVQPEKMDDRTLFRYPPDYRHPPLSTGLDWSGWGGFQRAVEMCNNNGACRKTNPGVMCPSFRATADERHLTRGRANTLRLAMSGQLGADGLVSRAMDEAMDLCVGCKGCKRECPTGVDMARMKIEYLHQRRKRYGSKMRDRLFAFLPRYAPYAAAFAGVLNLRNRIPMLAASLEMAWGIGKKRPLPKWRRDPFLALEESSGDEGSMPPRVFHRATLARSATKRTPRDEVVLFVDTFNTWFEPENARAVKRVLRAAGVEVHLATPPEGERRPLCCGRTFLSAGMLDEARHEMLRSIASMTPFIKRGVPVVGLEPSCMLTFKDEASALGVDLGGEAENFLLFEEFLGRNEPDIPLESLGPRRALLHGHCHQKAFGIMPRAEATLRLVPDLEVQTIPSGCCGMAGSFGYEAAHYDISMKMAELDLLPAIRKAKDDALIVAAGTSCRHQIAHGSGRTALHPGRVLEMALRSSK